MLQGKKTYITGAIMIAIYILENILGIDIPTVDSSGNLLLQGIALLTGRSAIKKLEK